MARARLSSRDRASEKTTSADSVTLARVYMYARVSIHPRIHYMYSFFCGNSSNKLFTFFGGGGAVL